MNFTRMNQFLFSLALMALLFAPAPVILAANKTEQPKQALSDLQQKLEALKKELGDSQEAQKDAADALKESELAISEANKKLFEITNQQRQNKKTLSQLASDTIATNRALAQQQKLLSSQVYQQYIHGQQSYVQMMLQTEHPSEIARNMHYYAYIAKARADLIGKMQVNLAKIAQLNAQTAAALKEVVELKHAKISEKHTLENQKQEKSKVVKSLSQQIASQRNEIKKLSRDEKRLSQLVERLARIIPVRPKAHKKATVPTELANEHKPEKEVVVSNDTLPSDEFEGANFASLKGKLKLPVRGEVANRFGSNREDTGISWKGLFIRANEGAEVKSVANGRIVFADWLRGFGNLVIVDHGSGYMSLYGNNQAVLRHVGEAISAGDTIASVGNSGGNETNGLYYELRRQSKPFDPLSWSNY